MNGSIRVLLADDQQLVRDGLRRILVPEEGFEIVAECRDGSEVSAATERGRPDVILMDARMPGMSGPDAIRRLKSAGNAPPVLVLTTFSDDEVLVDALRAGADGFLLKDAPGEEIVRATRVVASGASYLDPSITSRVLNVYREAARQPGLPNQLQTLTLRELEVLRLIGRGRSNEEIAAELFIGEATVKTHITRIFDKLGLRDRAAAIVLAFDAGLVSRREVDRDE